MAWNATNNYYYFGAFRKVLKFISPYLESKCQDHILNIGEAIVNKVLLMKVAPQDLEKILHGGEKEREV